MQLQGSTFGPPREVGSAQLLKKQGLTPVDIFFGEIRERPRTLVTQGESVLHTSGEVFYFVGVDERGKAILAEDEYDYKKMQKKLDAERHNWESPPRGASWVPGEILPESDSDSTWSPGGVDSPVMPEGEGSQVPPHRDRDGEEIPLKEAQGRNTPRTR